MNDPNTISAASMRFAQNTRNTVWPIVAGRRGLILFAALVVLGGIALNWSWLVGLGVAPVLLAALPCVLMCGVGLCMHRTAGNRGRDGADEGRPKEHHPE